MLHWKKELISAVENNDLASFNSILSLDYVRRKDRLKRRTWAWKKAPLHAAVRRGRDEMVQLLIKAGADVNSYETVVTAADGRFALTCLHWAALSPRGAAAVSTARMLLELGADVDLVGRYTSTFRGTPVEFARRSGFVRMVEVCQAAKTDAPSVEAVTEIIRSKPEKLQRMARAIKVNDEIKSLERRLGELRKGEETGFMTELEMQGLSRELDRILKWEEVFPKAEVDRLAKEEEEESAKDVVDKPLIVLE